MLLISFELKYQIFEYKLIKVGALIWAQNSYLPKYSIKVQFTNNYKQILPKTIYLECSFFYNISKL